MNETMKLPTLYKRNTNGTIQIWNITTNGAEIVSQHGIEGGAVVSSSDIVKEGKNAGKKNATTAVQQAQSEAQSKWLKQKKKGYVENIEDARSGAVDEAVIEGGAVVMLAHKFRDHAAKIKWPARGQPKLDGIRCIAQVKNGTCTLWSRTRHRITGLPALEAAILSIVPDDADITFDGELYNHDLRRDFENIVSLVRSSEAKEGSENIQYHIYDIVSDQKFDDRHTEVMRYWNRHPNVRIVSTVGLQNEEDMREYFAECMSQGYEGCMVRNADSHYKAGRSYDLQKVKEFDDAEFKVVGVEEGRGSMAGKAVFICETKSHQQFNVKMEGEMNRLAQYLKNPGLVVGKMLTVRYQGLTNANQVPRFPVGVAIRDYE